MNKKIYSIIMVMILLFSSASVYAAKPSDIPDIESPTYELLVAKNGGVYYYDGNILYSRTYENGKLVRGSNPATQDEWNAFLSGVRTGDGYSSYNPTASDDAVGSAIANMPRPPEPEKTPSAVEKTRKDVDKNRKPTGPGNPEKYKYLLGIVDEAYQNRESSAKTESDAYTRWQEAEARYTQLQKNPTNAAEYEQAETAAKNARLEYEESAETARLARQAYNELKEFQQNEIRRSSLTPGGVNARAETRQGYARSLAERDRELTSLLGTLDQQQSALEDQIDAAEDAGQNTEELEKELEEVEDQARTLREQQNNIRGAQLDYGKNLEYQNTLTDAINYNNNVAIPQAQKDYDAALNAYSNSLAEHQRMRGQIDDMQAAINKANAEKSDTVTIGGSEVPIDVAQTRLTNLRVEAGDYWEDTVGGAANDVVAANQEITGLRHQNTVFEKNKGELASRARFLSLQNEISVAQQNIEDLQARIAKEKDDKARSRLEEDLYDWERHLARTRNRAAWYAPWFSSTDPLLEIINVFGRGLIFLFDFVSAYNEYSGIGAYSSLDSSMAEKLNERRRETAEHFCQDIVYLAGTSCLQSTICQRWRGQQEFPPGTNILTTEIPNVGRMPAASIQAEKSMPIWYEVQGQQRTKCLYKLTFFIENPHLDNVLSYHIELRGSKTYKSESQSLAGRKLTSSGREERGGYYGQTGANPLIFEGQHDYATACLVFSPRIFVAGGGYASEICVPIQQYSGAATRPYELPAGTQAQLQNATGPAPSGLSMDGA